MFVIFLLQPYFYFEYFLYHKTNRTHFPSLRGSFNAHLLWIHQTLHKCTNTSLCTPTHPTYSIILFNRSILTLQYKFTLLIFILIYTLISHSLLKSQLPHFVPSSKPQVVLSGYFHHSSLPNTKTESFLIISLCFRKHSPYLNHLLPLLLTTKLFLFPSSNPKRKRKKKPIFFISWHLPNWNNVLTIMARWRAFAQAMLIHSIGVWQLMLSREVILMRWRGWWKSIDGLWWS